MHCAAGWGRHRLPIASHRLPIDAMVGTQKTRVGMPKRSAPTNQHGQHVEGTQGIITTERGEHARMPMPCNMPTLQFHPPTHTIGWFHCPWHNLVHIACTHMLESVTCSQRVCAHIPTSIYLQMHRAAGWGRHRLPIAPHRLPINAMVDTQKDTYRHAHTQCPHQPTRSACRGYPGHHYHQAWRECTHAHAL
jgi:hypothetical protein